MRELSLPGVIRIEPKVFEDKRGYFMEIYNKQYPARFVQSNVSKSSLATLRGLHGQRKKPQGKLITVVEGIIFDVAADPKTGKWVGETLDDRTQLYIPPGYLHGFFVVSETALVEYKCTEYYDPADEIGVVYNDPDFNIAWPVPYPKISPKDSKLPLLRNIKI